MTIAETMYNIMIEQQKQYVWLGDLDLIDECITRSKIKCNHPYNDAQKILNALDRRPDLFEKRYLLGDTNNVNRTRRYRCFKTIKKAR